MAERIIAAVLMVCFAFLFYSALSDLVHLVEGRSFDGVFLLLFCVIVSAGWIAFLAALALPRASQSRLHWHGLNWHRLNWH
jgi:ABC-type transport system involved in cytochrome c biogenesis permease subunit